MSSRLISPVPVCCRVDESLGQLQGRNSDTEEWQTLDMFEGNRNNYTDRSFTATSVRYLRLFVIAPTQGQDSAARIYELEVY